MHEIRNRSDPGGKGSRCRGFEKQKSRRSNLEGIVLESGVVFGIESVHLIMIAMELLFRVQINSEMVMPITLSGVNLKTKVETLKQEAAERWNLPKDSFGRNDFVIWRLQLFVTELFVFFVTQF